MISLGVKNMDNKEAVATVYGAAVTKTINSFATLSFSMNATGNNLVAVNMLGPGTIFTAPDGQKYQYTLVIQCRVLTIKYTVLPLLMWECSWAIISSKIR